MSWIDKLERKFGRICIRNLTTYLIGAYIIGYLFKFISPDAIAALSLNPYRILHGEVWRIVTWILVPPEQFSIFTIIMLIFYYSIGTSLEKSWGSFRYNVYIFGGILLTILGAFGMYFMYDFFLLKSEFARLNVAMSPENMDIYYRASFQLFSTYYINMSIFLAYAATCPNMQVLLYFVIPIKIKWLAYLDVAFLLFDCYKYMNSGLWAGVGVIIISLLNFLIFFLSTRNYKRISPGEVHRRREYARQVNNSAKITKHKCAVCGRTDEDHPELEFRFCSKCIGNYEYCQEHLFTHEHVK